MQAQSMQDYCMFDTTIWQLTVDMLTHRSPRCPIDEIDNQWKLIPLKRYYINQSIDIDNWWPIDEEDLCDILLIAIHY